MLPGVEEPPALIKTLPPFAPEDDEVESPVVMVPTVIEVGEII